VATVTGPKERERRSLGAAISGNPPFKVVQQAAEIGSLLVLCVRHAVTPPFEWVPDAVVEANRNIRKCLLPLGLSMVTWVVGYAFILLTGFVRLIGAPDRMPGGLVLGFTREPIVWVTGMIYAGSAGAAMSADLAARKNREELDALAVLGVNRIRHLVLPRVAASAIACPVLGLFAIFVTIATVYLLGPLYVALSPRLIFDGIVQSLVSIDDLAAVIKFFLFGTFVAVISCAQGLSAERGVEGVGRAVNRNVVLTFAGIWVINSLFNIAYLTIFPQLADFKG
jgi:phospholipid/cholesterol/gamma-HCH transport system permease protein